ncbi:VirB8/TrbF family protein [Vibrio sp. WXL103]|uniref:VirB8/TrbF family protein n=1 Tax=unclassified Vibrio TaxID=2614977 RepID=UPI003EC4D712
MDDVVNTCDDTQPTPQAPLIAQLRSERNRWFFATLGSFGLIGLLTLFCWYAFSKAETNKEIVYVKLAPNGTWSVIDYQPQDSQLYYKTTIDSALERFVIARYQLHPATINRDWGEAMVFMGADLRTHFLSPDGFNARGKMAALQKNTTQTDITIRSVEHYDSVEWQSDAQSVGQAIRSNIYFSRTRNPESKSSKPEALVLNVQWRLVDKSTLTNRSIDEIRVNPIGVEILTTRLTKERSSD